MPGGRVLDLACGSGRHARYMASLGHPVAGDPVYGPHNVIRELHGQCLHAGTLGFVHPRTGEYLEFTAPLPDYFTDFLQKLQREELL